MTKVIITNGFPNTGGLGIILTVRILEGNIKVGDILVIDDQNKIPIIQIDFFFDNRAALTIEREHDHNPAVSYKLYGNSYLIESI